MAERCDKGRDRTYHGIGPLLAAIFDTAGFRFWSELQPYFSLGH
jgi:hypothetical protein